MIVLHSVLHSLRIYMFFRILHLQNALKKAHAKTKIPHDFGEIPISWGILVFHFWRRKRDLNRKYICVTVLYFAISIISCCFLCCIQQKTGRGLIPLPVSFYIFYCSLLLMTFQKTQVFEIISCLSRDFLSNFTG